MKTVFVVALMITLPVFSQSDLLKSIITSLPAQTLLSIDHYQTYRIATDTFIGYLGKKEFVHTESNKILGPHPSQLKVHTYFGSIHVGHFLLTHQIAKIINKMLRFLCQTLLQSTIVIIQFKVVKHNARVNGKMFF